MSATLLPLVGVPADMKDDPDVPGGLPFHRVGDKYLAALLDVAGVLPVMIPAFGEALAPAQLIGRLDGLLLTGSKSNVHPELYGEPEKSEHAVPFDHSRDATTLPLTRAALAEGLPLLAICRGWQELNVALGGTLNPLLHETPGLMDHRRVQHPDPDRQYGEQHHIEITPGSTLAEVLGTTRLDINSLHNQGVERPGERLKIEAWAEDGTPEGGTVRDAPGFALGVQWHPEYKAAENPYSVRLFEAFGDAVRAYAARRRDHVVAAQ